MVYSYVVNVPQMALLIIKSFHSRIDGIQEIIAHCNLHKTCCHNVLGGSMRFLILTHCVQSSR